MRIIIDGNAMGWAHHSATKLTYGGIETQAVFGFVKMLREFRYNYPAAPITVLWDGQAKKRFALLPSYKESREQRRQEDTEAQADHNSYKQASAIIQVACRLLGVTQLLHPDYEADDLAGLLCARLPGRKLLVTGDSDWLQLVSSDVTWYDPRRDGKQINISNFHELTGYASPLEHLHGKTLRGDDSDDIPGIQGFGKIETAKFIAKWATLDAFFAAVDAGTYTPATRKGKTAKTPHPEQMLASPEGRAVVARNFALMDLRDPVIEIESIKVERGNLEPEKVVTLFERLGFVSLLRDFPAFIHPFHSQTSVCQPA
jgi:5'-3' exonuclease